MKGHCYGFMEQTLSWYDARNRCKQEGESYDLVVIDDNNENQFLKDKIINIFEKSDYWIGMKENDNDYGFVWIDGSDVTFNNWRKGEPNDVITFLF